jgi:hypothetical protein
VVGVKIAAQTDYVQGSLEKPYLRVTTLPQRSIQPSTYSIVLIDGAEYNSAMQIILLYKRDRMEHCDGISEEHPLSECCGT